MCVRCAYVCVHEREKEREITSAISAGKGGRIRNEVGRLSSLNLLCNNADGRAASFAVFGDCSTVKELGFGVGETRSPGFLFSAVLFPAS